MLRRLWLSFCVGSAVLAIALCCVLVDEGWRKRSRMLACQEAMSKPPPSVDAARAAYDAMEDWDKDRVVSMKKAGVDRLVAVQTVQASRLGNCNEPDAGLWWQALLAMPVAAGVIFGVHRWGLWVVGARRS